MNHPENIRLNQAFAALVLAVSFIVYYLTMAPTVSYWDCGEFIATSYILGVPHPPGSPLYLILGRIFSMLPTNPDIAFRVNIISPIVSALACMLLYLIIVKIVLHWRGKIRDNSDIIVAFGSALVGSLTFAFTDSHWFNAVEAEVYAMSTFFTAIVVWLILLWSERADDPGSERYILIIAYMFGLATGVHILNLLTLPFIALIVYFRKMKFEWKTFFITMAITAAVFLVIHNGIIKGLPKLAQVLGLGGVAAIIVITFAVTIWAINNKRRLLSLMFSSLILILVGYSSYVTIFIRSGQDPRIDENDPETITRAISYLEREQYGAVGQLPRKYIKNKVGTPTHKAEIVGNPENVKRDQKGRIIAREFSGRQNRKYMFHNFGTQWEFFWGYQVKKMYWRYFLWQFAGRGPTGEPGVTAFGANSPAHPSPQDGVYWFHYGLPLAFLLGLLGVFYHFNKDGEEAFSVLTLFLMIGLAVILYLNQDNPQPRERDYSYVGSFLAFSIWVGIGTAAISDWVLKFVKEKQLGIRLASFLVIFQLLAVPGLMLRANYHEHDRSGNLVAWDYSYNLLQSCEPNAVLFTNGDNDTFPLWYLQEVEGIRTDVTVANLSLLNTPWYIRQLREIRNAQDIAFSSKEFSAAAQPVIKLSDKQIRSLTRGLTPWQKREVTLPVNSQEKITWTVKPTYAGQALKIQDMMIMQIINDANWASPIYFAVTVSPSNRLGLEPYLEMDGLSYRLRPYKTKGLNPENMSKHLVTEFGQEEWSKPFNSKEWNKDEGRVWFKTYDPRYLFRHLGNEDVYYNEQVVRLLQNYRSAYMQLAVHYFMDFQKLSKEQKVGDNGFSLKTKVMTVLDEMNENIPENTIRIHSKELYYQMGRLYYGVGQSEKLREVLNNLLLRDDITIKDRVGYGQSYLVELDEPAVARDIFETLYNSFNEAELIVQTRGLEKAGLSSKSWKQWQNNYSNIVSHLVIAYQRLEMEAEAETVLTGWLDRNPNDRQAKKLLNEIKGTTP